jgi:hypothetical protein
MIALRNKPNKKRETTMTTTKNKIATVVFAAITLTAASFAISGIAAAKGMGGHGGFGGHGHGMHFSHFGGHKFFHGHYHLRRSYFAGYFGGYRTCWRWTPEFGWINACRIRYVY